jgi:DNA-binding NarL/FixJ family response regulator
MAAFGAMTLGGAGRLRVLVAADHPAVRERLRLLLGGEPDIELVGVATDGPSAIRATQALVPDVLVLDHQLPVQDGAEVATVLARRGFETRIVIYSADDRIHELALPPRVVRRIGKDGSFFSLLTAIRQATAASAPAR